MTEADDIDVPTLDAPTRSMLEGLATIHAITLACDREGQLCFAHDPQAHFVPTDFTPAGHSIEALGSETLCRIARDERPPSPTELDASPPGSASASGAAHASGGPHVPPEGRCVVRRFDIEDAQGRQRRILVADPIPDLAGLTRKHADLESSLRGLSHDLRTPLASVLGFTRLLQDQFGESIGRTGRHFIERIEQAGHNMQRLLEDTLELARLDEAQRYPVHVSPTAVLEQIAAEYKLSLDDAGIALHFPQDAPVIVCDRTQLYQLFSNLIGNAIRHAGSDTGANARRTRRIDVTIEARPGHFEIAVEDDGPGVAPPDTERIFRAFETAGPPRPGSPRGGLGLAIVGKIVAGHGGRVWVEHAEGGGARFVVHLPAEP